MSRNENLLLLGRTIFSSRVLGDWSDPLKKIHVFPGIWGKRDCESKEKVGQVECNSEVCRRDGYIIGIEQFQGFQHNRHSKIVALVASEVQDSSQK